MEQGALVMIQLHILEHTTNLSNALMNESGREDNFTHIFCYIVEQVPDDGVCITHMIDENHELKVRIWDWDNVGVYWFLYQKEERYIHHTLRYYLNHSDSNSTDLSIVVGKTKKLNNAFLRSCLQPHQKRMESPPFYVKVKRPVGNQ